MTQRTFGHLMSRALLVATIFFGANSQAATSDYTYGFFGGLSSFDYRTSSAGSSKNEWGNGVYAGFFGEIPLSSRMYLTPGLSFVQKGTKTTTGSISAEYVETAAMLRWYFWNTNDWRAYLGVGPSYGVLLTSELDQSGTVSDFTRSMARNDFSVQGGLGLEFPLSGTIGMQLGATYSRTLSNTLNSLNSGGIKSHWEGAYAFASWRFKSNQSTAVTVHDRAEEYLKFKNASPASKNDGLY